MTSVAQGFIIAFFEHAPEVHQQTYWGGDAPTNAYVNVNPLGGKPPRPE